jgi:hypothetical protein
MVEPEFHVHPGIAMVMIGRLSNVYHFLNMHRAALLLRPITVSLTGAIVGGMGAIAPGLAEPVIYDFTVQVRTGSLAGNRFTGTVRFDSEAFTGVGRETIGVEDGLAVKMQFYGMYFGAMDDVNYPEFPRVNLNNGELESLDFWIEPGARGSWWNLPGWEIELTRRGDTDR